MKTKTKLQLQLAALFIIITTSVLAAREARNKQRRLHSRLWLYLHRGDLQPNPHVGPWQRLWESQDDCAFTTPMGFKLSVVIEGSWFLGALGEHPLSLKR